MLLVLTFNYENMKHFTQHQGDLIAVCTVLWWPRTAIDIFTNNFFNACKNYHFYNIFVAFFFIYFEKFLISGKKDKR